MLYARILLITGAILLGAVAVLHGSGIGAVTAFVTAAAGDDFLKTALRASWLMPSAHLLLVAALLIVAAVVERVPRLIVLGLGAIPLVDAVIVFSLFGWFPPAGVLLLAGLLVWGGALLRPA